MNSQNPLPQKFGVGPLRNGQPMWRTFFDREKPGLYVFLVLTAAIAGSAFAVRSNGIFACQALNHESDLYLAYCQAKEFGDYDHGAFWFNLEDNATEAASEATVLFIGNSRMQFGLSTDKLDQWFSSHSISYYLLGFSHMENHVFVEPLLQKLKPIASIYILNIDVFFEHRSNEPATAVMHDPESFNRYKQKRRWQSVHEFLCGKAAFLCRNEVAFYRSRATGAWIRKGGIFSSQPVSFDMSVDLNTVAAYAEEGAKFLADISQDRDCIFLTNVPQSNTSAGTAKALARKMGLPLIAPNITGLTTFDGSHLDHDSAARWSAAFVDLLGPHIQNCLSGTGR